MPPKNGYKGNGGRSSIARKVKFGGSSPTNGFMPNIMVKTTTGEMVRTSYFGGPKKGGSQPSATGFMIASGSRAATTVASPAQRPNFLFKFGSIVNDSSITVDDNNNTIVALTTDIYIGLLFNENVYNEGINDIINIINNQYPNNTLIINKYITNNTLTKINDILDMFIQDYPEGNRILISTTTFTLSSINDYLNTKNISIPSFSLSSTSNRVKTFNNVLTYAPYDQYSVMNNFMILTEYNLSNVTILYEPNTTSDIFFSTYEELVYKQGDLLGIPVSTNYLISNTTYDISENSLIIILCNTVSLTNNYIVNILDSIHRPSTCCISLTDINDDCGDIFDSIPAFVMIPFVIDYTTTTQLVYNDLTNKKAIFYGVYTFFDILATLITFSTIKTEPKLELTISNFLSVNPFSEFPSAYGYGLFDKTINGSRYGSYELVFTKDIIIGSDIEIFNLHNNGGIGSLPNSQSIFKSMGIVPFFTTQIFNCNQDYFKFYSNDGTLLFTRFDKSVTTYNSNSIIISENLACQFAISFNSEGFFASLINLPLRDGNNPTINETMSKKIIEKIYPI
jgi:hypothetical protein